MKGKIFSKPLETPSKKPGAESTAPAVPANVGEAKESPVRQRSLNGRKPRISRSKVIARLASQRETAAAAAAGVTGAAGSTTRAVLATPGRTDRRKSSLAPKPGAKTRSSLGAVKARTSTGGSAAGVLASAKKRVRQSEYYDRQKSRVERMDVGV